MKKNTNENICTVHSSDCFSNSSRIKREEEEKNTILLERECVPCPNRRVSSCMSVGMFYVSLFVVSMLRLFVFIRLFSIAQVNFTHSFHYFHAIISLESCEFHLSLFTSDTILSNCAGVACMQTFQCDTKK